MVILDLFRRKGYRTDLASALLETMLTSLDHMRGDKAHIERLSRINTQF
jgi:hypothetical protein